MEKNRKKAQNSIEIRGKYQKIHKKAKKICN